MTPSERLAATALAYALGRFAVFDEQPGYCLRVVRQLVSPALGLSYDVFKERYWTQTVEDNTTGIPWARDMQRSLRANPYAVPAHFEKRMAGDLVFAHDLGKPQGHVAVIVARAGEHTAIIENTHSQRGVQLSGFNRLSRLEDWPSKNLEVFRLIEP